MMQVITFPCFQGYQLLVNASATERMDKLYHMADRKDTDTHTHMQMREEIGKHQSKKCVKGNYDDQNNYGGSDDSDQGSVKDDDDNEDEIMMMKR